MKNPALDGLKEALKDTIKEVGKLKDDFSTSIDADKLKANSLAIFIEETRKRLIGNGKIVLSGGFGNGKDLLSRIMFQEVIKDGFINPRKTSYELILNKKLNRTTFLEVFSDGTKKATRVETTDENFVSWEFSYLLVKAKYYIGNEEFHKLVDYMWKRFKRPTRRMIDYLEGVVGQYEQQDMLDHILELVKVIDKNKSLVDYNHDTMLKGLPFTITFK